MTADATVEAPWLLGGVKAISYAVNMAALRYARASGADEVIFTSADGQLLEAPTATVVWLAGGVLRTPPPAPLGILDGVTVRHLFRAAAAAGFGTEIQRGTVADLHAADGVWLLSSVRIAAAVLALDGKPLATDPDDHRTDPGRRRLGRPVISARAEFPGGDPVFEHSETLCGGARGDVPSRTRGGRWSRVA